MSLRRLIRILNNWLRDVGKNKYYCLLMIIMELMLSLYLLKMKNCMMYFLSLEDINIYSGEKEIVSYDSRKIFIFILKFQDGWLHSKVFIKNDSLE